MVKMKRKNEVKHRATPNSWLPPIHKFFLEMQILRHKQLLNNKRTHIHANILPNTRPWTNSKRNPWRQNYGFLNYRVGQKDEKNSTTYDSISTRERGKFSF